MDRLQDRHIIGLIQSDPERGFRMLINRFKETVYWHIRRLVVSHDDAEDATQGPARGPVPTEPDFM